MTDEDKDCGSDFPIREFLDLRILRCTYLLRGGKPVRVDSGGNPETEGDEEDFGLQRSSCEDAAAFLRDNLCESAEAEPDLREFLDDDD